MAVPARGRVPRALAGLGLLVFVVTALHGIGHPALAPPVLTDPTSWAAWADGREPVAAAMAVVRLVAIGLAWYLLAVAVLQVAATTTSTAAVTRLARLVTTSSSRHVATAIVGAGIMAATPTVSPVTSGDAGHAARPGEDDPPPTLQRLAPTLRRLPAINHHGPGTTGRGPIRPPTLTRLPDRDESRDRPPPRPIEQAGPTRRTTPPDDQQARGTAVTDDRPAGTGDRRPGATGAAAGGERRLPERGEVAVGRRSRAATRPPDSTWTVVAGDHFWGIAQRELDRRLGRPATADEVAPWWRALVDVNRDRLVDPCNPDLILPGQVMRWPPPSRPGGRHQVDASGSR